MGNRQTTERARHFTPQKRDIPFHLKGLNQIKPDDSGATAP